MTVLLIPISRGVNVTLAASNNYCDIVLSVIIKIFLTALY